MKPTSIGQLTVALSGELRRGEAAQMFCGPVETDTRQLSPGCLFIALRGERFDAHQFLDQAAQAAAVIVSQDVPVPEGPAIIRVEDTLLALQDLATWYRLQLDWKVIGLTGSNGKTSTKNFTAAVLGTRFSVCATPGNLNNHIGLPLSILRGRQEDQIGLFEMGMNHAGEISPLCHIAEPQYGIITHIGRAHLEHLGTPQAIADEKGTLARSLPRRGALFLPDQTPFADYLASLTPARVVRVGHPDGLHARQLQPTPQGMHFTLAEGSEIGPQVPLPVAGEHMVRNALLAAAVGRELGLTLEEIAHGLSQADLGTGRLRHLREGKIDIFDDSYNASPDSVLAAIQTLAQHPLPQSARRFLVLGTLAELGDHRAAAHREVGHAAEAAGLQLLAVGEHANEFLPDAPTGATTPTQKEALTWLQSHLRPGDAVLFKASRSARLDQLLQAYLTTL